MLRLIALVLLAIAAHAQPRLDTLVDWIAPAPAASRTVYAYSNGALFRTRDLGATWTALSIRPTGTPQPELARLLVTVSSPNVLYALGRARDGGVWRSVDGGDTWRTANFGLPASADFLSDGVIDTVDPNLIYARVGVDIYKTTTGGAEWFRVGTISPAGPYLELLVSSGGNRTLYYANTGTLFRSINDGATWQHVYASPGVQRFRSVAVDRLSPDTLLAHHSGDLPDEPADIVRSRDGGFHWDTLPPAGRIDRLIAASGNVLYALTSAGAIVRTVSGGNQWSISAPGLARTIAVDPVDPAIVYLGANGVSRSTDGGATFTPLAGTVRPNFARPVPDIRFRIRAGDSASIVVPVRALENEQWTIPFEASTNASWLRWTASTGVTPARPALLVDTSNLEPGSYSAEATLESPQAATRLTFPVTIQIDPDAGPSAPQFSPTVAARTPSPATALTVDASSNLFFATEEGVFRANADAPASLLAAIRNVTGLAAAPDGGLFVARSMPPAVLRVADGTVSTLFNSSDTPAPTSVPARVRLDPQGRVLVAATTAVLRFSTADTPPISSVLAAPAGAAFTDAAADAAGNLYIVDSARHAVYQWTASDRTLSLVAGRPGSAGLAGDGGPASESLLNTPAAIARGADGTLYVADSGNGRIRIITRDARIFSLLNPFLVLFGGNSGDDVVIDETGALYSSNRFRSIHKLAPLNNLPEIFRGGFINSASNRPTLSPGSLFTLYGRNLAAPAGASVTIKGRLAPLFFASVDQINGQVPYETEPGLAAAIVTKGSLTSTPESTLMLPAAPGVLTYGEGRAVTSPDSVQSGALMNVFLTGIGPLDNPVATGAAASDSPLSRASSPARATLAGRECEITYLGLTPGSVALAHATIRIPTGLPPGDHTLVIRINGVESNPALITVTAPQP